MTHYCSMEDLKPIHKSLCMKYREYISSRSSSNSEAYASELLEDLEWNVSSSLMVVNKSWANDYIEVVTLTPGL